MKRQIPTDISIYFNIYLSKTTPLCFSVQAWSHDSPRPAETYCNELRVLVFWGRTVSWDVPTGSFLNIGSSGASSALESHTREENQVTCWCLWFITLWIVFFTMLGNKTTQVKNGDGKCSSLFVSFRLLYFPLCCQIGAAWRYILDLTELICLQTEMRYRVCWCSEKLPVWIDELCFVLKWHVRRLQTDMRMFQALTTEWTKFYFNSEQLIGGWSCHRGFAFDSWKPSSNLFWIFTGN